MLGLSEAQEVQRWDYEQVAAVPDPDESRVIEAVARQRAQAELALSRTVVSAERLPELGRRMACQEIARELGMEDAIWTRALKLASRAKNNSR